MRKERALGPPGEKMKLEASMVISTCDKDAATNRCGLNAEAG